MKGTVFLNRNKLLNNSDFLRPIRICLPPPTLNGAKSNLKEIFKISRREGWLEKEKENLRFRSEGIEGRRRSLRSQQTLQNRVQLTRHLDEKSSLYIGPSGTIVTTQLSLDKLTVILSPPGEMTPRIELECQRYTTNLWSDLRQTFESNIGKWSQQHLKGTTLNMNMLHEGTKWTYAQGTKLMAVAGGIKAVPLKMMGLRSSVSIQFGGE